MSLLLLGCHGDWSFSYYWPIGSIGQSIDIEEMDQREQQTVTQTKTNQSEGDVALETTPLPDSGADAMNKA